jgi:transcriptional regulator of acetoin/glycerol metabolism
MDGSPTSTPERDHSLLVDSKLIDESHRRCFHAGTNPHGNKCPPPNKQGWGDSANNLAGLRAYARGMFGDIYRWLPDQGCLLILTDSTTRIISVHSHTDVLEEVSATAGVQLGTTVDEVRCGTNAVALALSLRDSVAIRGEQHFCRVFRNWTCVASPILDHLGKAAACVNIATPYEGPIGEKLALARLLAGDLSNSISFGAIDSRIHAEESAAHSVTHRVALTLRQQQVLKLFADGLSYKKIARQLGLSSTKTVTEHLDAIKGKLAASNRRECIRKALEQGLLR